MWDGEALPGDVADQGADALASDFDTFFVVHARRLRLALWLITRDLDEAEELAQEAFLRVFERWDEVRTMDRPEGYLFRTGSNLARNRRRHLAMAMRRAVHLEARSVAYDDFGRVEGDDRIERALETLSRRQRTSLVLVDLLGLDSDEAAAAMGIKSSTVRVHLTRARAALRERMEDDGGH